MKKTRRTLRYHNSERGERSSSLLFSCKLFSSSFSALVHENVWPPFSFRTQELKQKLSNFVESGVLSGRQIGHRHVMMSAASDSPICSSRSNVSKLSSSRHDEEKKLGKSLYRTVIISHLLIVLGPMPPSGRRT